MIQFNGCLQSRLPSILRRAAEYEDDDQRLDGVVDVEEQANKLLEHCRGIDEETKKLASAINWIPSHYLLEIAEKVDEMMDAF